ncbi:phosphate ABC transporter permease PstA [Actinocatenispora rupis]|uniref:phosphate ABC transporter permease PstA n=1 Tax=Actinocatenispora rupis TaxID=519421 RepID=UPI0019424C25|nr:phosphate ABC transporter permease PstA [Actinocatenispora rupis]
MSHNGSLRGRRLPKAVPPVIAVAAVLASVAGIYGTGAGGWVLTVVVAALVFALVTLAVAWAVEGGRHARDRLATIAVYGAFIIALLPLGSVIITLLRKGTSRLDADFFYHSMNNITALDSGGGAYHAIIGTLEQVGIACVLAIPLGLAAAVYIVEYGRGRLASTIRFFVDVMTGIPSIVAGLFILAFWVLIVTPVFNHGRPGYSGFAAALALTVLMLPTIVRSAEEMLRLVPTALREGSYALGVPKWKTIMRVVLPTALPGIVTGVMLALARAAGETAPVLLVAGGTPAINFNPFSGNQESLSYFVYEQAGAASKYAPGRAWTAALTLIALVAILTIAAKLLARRSKIGR